VTLLIGSADCREARTATLPVTACVVNYNGEDFLEATMDAALQQRPAFTELLLVDNASSDRSLTLVAEKYPSVAVVSLGSNRGPAAARNAGFAAAANDRILFLDNDVMLDDGCLAELVSALEAHSNAAVAMPRVLYAHDPMTIQYDGADCHCLGMLVPLNADTRVSHDVPHPRTIGSVISACFLLDRRRCRMAPPFDENFFIYFEDFDFGIRIRAEGREILSVPKAQCFHRDGTAGLSLRRTGRYTGLRVYCIIRNRWQTLAKNYEISTLIRLAPALLCFEVLQLAGAIRKGWFREWVRACGWMLRHSTEVMRRRREVQKRRVVSDASLFCAGRVPFTDRLAQGRFERRMKALLEWVANSNWRLVERRL